MATTSVSPIGRKDNRMDAILDITERNNRQIVYEYICAMQLGQFELAARIYTANPDLRERFVTSC